MNENSTNNFISIDPNDENHFPKSDDYKIRNLTLSTVQNKSVDDTIN